MNCKQGDLARTVNFEAAIDFLNDRIVRCVKFLRIKDIDGWQLEDAIVVEKHNGFLDVHKRLHLPNIAFKIEWIGDSHLRPIRSPGDDEQDETLQWNSDHLTKVQS